MHRCTRIIQWDAAHRVLRHESKCASLHGHRYKAEITCEAPLDAVGRVVDFGVIKQKVGEWVDEHWDHAAMAHPDDVSFISWCEDNSERGVYLMPQGEPTAEHIAEELFAVTARLIGTDGLRVVKVRVWETPNCYADFEA